MSIRSNYGKVQEFHHHFRCTRGKLGQYPTPERLLLRVRLMIGELAELVEAMQIGDYPNTAKELGDLLYVVYGTADEYGLPMDEIFDAVHESNMSKDGTRDSGGKITKGPDYQPPDIEAVLEAALRGK